MHFVIYLGQIIKKRSNFYISLLCTLLIVLNLNSKKSFFSFPYLSQPDQYRNINFQPQFNGFIKKPPPPYKKAFQYIKDTKLSGNYFILDTTYGIFNEIINGFNIEDVTNQKFSVDIQLNNDKDFKLSLALNNDLNVKAVLIPKAFNNDYKYLESYLLNHNWKINKEFTDSRFDTKITIYSRNK